MPKLLFALLIPALLLAGCGNGDNPEPGQDEAAPYVRLAKVEADGSAVLPLSAEVRARRESPLAFQVGGQIEERLVDGGETVTRGQPLLTLNKRDLQENLNAARADAEAAKASLALARSDLERDQQLFDDQHLSRQALDRSKLREQEARTRLEAAQAQVTLAENSLGYGQLKAPADGVLLSVSGEPGQVVGAGEPVARLAHDTRQEVEVFFPQGVQPPPEGRLHTGGENSLGLSLREVSASLDPQSRTRRARYQLDEPGDLVLGSIARATFSLTGSGAPVLKIPLGALDERGDGPQVWQVVDGKTRGVPVKIVSLDNEFAHIRADLSPGQQVVAMGTHLLRPDMPVRVRD